MSTFHLYQRVRIVRLDSPDAPPAVIGAEGFISSIEPFSSFGYTFPYCVCIPSVDDDIGVFAHEIEPLTYLPDAADLATRENAPDFDLRAPVRETESPTLIALYAGVAA
jgi:hypothetical protein